MNYSIGQFANITNISAHILRYYEKEKLLIVNRGSEYALLRYQGDSTMQLRLVILEKHKLAVVEEKAKWESNLLNLDLKIRLYRSKLNKEPAISS